MSGKDKENIKIKGIDLGDNCAEKENLCQNCPCRKTIEQITEVQNAILESLGELEEKVKSDNKVETIQIKKDKETNEYKPQHCDNCSEFMSPEYLNETDQNSSIWNKQYCATCLPEVEKGIFQCYEYGCDSVIDTRDRTSKFFIDLNHNIFCEDCWTEDEEKLDHELPKTNEDESIENRNKYSHEREKHICYYCEEETEVWIKKGENTYRCEDHTHCLKMAKLKGLVGKELNQKCYKCNQTPKFIIREDNKDINSKFKCQDEKLCDKVVELNNKINKREREIEEEMEEGYKQVETRNNLANQEASQRRANKDKLFACSWCNKEYWESPLCPEHQKKRKEPNEVHHGTKAPDGTCQQCLRELPTTKEWNGKYYCQDCKNWNDEQSQEGIGSYGRRFNEGYCDNCGKCKSCKARKPLKDISTRDLMIEVMERPEFEALLSWEDDGFKSRYGEIMWELTQVEGLSPEEIEKLVNEDVFEKPVSKRKFSRG